MIGETIHIIVYTSIGLFVLTWLGNLVCRKMLNYCKIGLNVTLSNEDIDPRTGRWIGGLERMLISFGILANSWEILVAVIALKTVARFKELDERIQAEYFLVGSLFSIIWAFATTMLWMLYDIKFGENILKWVQSILL